MDRWVIHDTLLLLSASIIEPVGPLLVCSCLQSVLVLRMTQVCDMYKLMNVCLVCVMRRVGGKRKKRREARKNKTKSARTAPRALKLLTHVA